MHDRLGFALRLSSSLLVLSGYLALGSVMKYGAGVVLIPLIPLAAAPWAERLDARFALYRVFSRAAVILYLCFLPLSVLTLGLLDAVIALVMFIQLYLLLHEKTARNFYHMYLMAFFLLLAACTQSPEPAIAVVLLLFLLAAIWAFLTLRLYVERNASRTRSQPEIIGLGERPGARVFEARNLFDGGLVFCVMSVSMVALAITAAVFLFTPRIEAGFLGNDRIQIVQTGIDTSIEVGQGNFVQEDNTPVMMVRFPGEPGGKLVGVSDLYWRIITHTQYFQGRWERDWLKRNLEPGVAALSPHHARHYYREDPSTIDRTPRPGQRVVHQEIYVDTVPETGLPCLDLPQRIQLKNAGRDAELVWDRAMDFSVMLSPAGLRHVTYEVWSEVGEPNKEKLREAPLDYSGWMDEQDYKMLTYHRLSPELVELTQQVAADQDTAYGKALAIERWLSGPQFEYTLDTPLLPPEGAIDAFVLQVRQGHCELYATAMALMLRTLGIPSRIVSGYRGGEWSDANAVYTVRASMAHLWVEAYFAGQGWVTFDPAPRENARTPQGFERLANAVMSFLLRAKMFWFQEVVSFDREGQLARLNEWRLHWFRSWSGPNDASREETEGPARGQAAALSEALESDGGFRWFSLSTAAAAGAVAAGFVMLVMLLIGASRHARPAAALSADQQQAVRVYRQIQRVLHRNGIDARGETALEMAEHVQAFAGGAVRETLTKALDIYEQARFGGRPLPRDRSRALCRELWRLPRLQ